MNIEDFYWGEISPGVEERAKHRKEGHDSAMRKVKDTLDKIFKRYPYKVTSLEKEIYTELNL
jgi:hypothetical protein